MTPRVIVLLVVATICAGCASPRASFYRLSPDAASDTAGASAIQQAVIVGPVTVPELVDRPQIVTRSTNNEISINEYARWGEPLKSGIADAIAGNLGLMLGSDRVAVASRAPADARAWRVRVDIQQFESVPGEAVVIDARWSVRRDNDSGAVTDASGRSFVREPVNGGDTDALIAAHDRALTRVSRDIATAIRSGH
ncbi:PqiC family protein [Caballeronia sp. LZ032]|uniref:PqiC family protein n=1 Tax=Caballeronia sp. LZ032 TaxID=3038565 RepID=UPI0028633FFC|nr:PqiC family protein [Caballeronia sp. LZ032]MDR5881847.1 PqiC family protein [Caballeronia sp. LZ032]